MISFTTITDVENWVHNQIGSGWMPGTVEATARRLSDLAHDSGLRYERDWSEFLDLHFGENTWLQFCGECEPQVSSVRSVEVHKTVNDNPVCVVTVKDYWGRSRYYAGPHGVSETAVQGDGFATEDEAQAHAAKLAAGDWENWSDREAVEYEDAWENA